MRKTTVALVSTLTGALLAASPALADGQLVGRLTAPIVDHNTWYLQGGGGVDIVNLPDWKILFDSTAGFGNPVSYDASVLGGGYSFTLGHVFGQQLDPQVGGGRVHVSMTGYYYHGDDKSTHRTGDSPDMSFIGLFDGLEYGFNTPLEIGFASAIRSFGAELRAGIDYPLGEGTWITPSVAFFGGHSDIEQRANIENEANTPLPNFFDRISQNLDSTRVGAAAGLGATIALGGGIYLKGGGQVGLTYNNTSADIRQCFSAFENSFRVCDGLGLDETLSTKRDAIGFVAAGGLGFDVDLGYAVVGIAGQVGYDSATPTFDYPDTLGEGVRLRHRGSWNYGGGVVLTIPIN